MGDPKKQRKKYKTPSHPWQGERIESEKKIVEDFGLKNKREIMKASSEVRRITLDAKRIIRESKKDSAQVKKEEKQLLNRLIKYNLITPNDKIEDVLKLTMFNVLERRLQTVVHKKGLARTVKQARQLIIHGHVAINGAKVTVPSYLVPSEEENNITYLEKSPFSSAEHAERVKGEKKRKGKEIEEVKEALGDEFKEVIEKPEGVAI